MDNYGVENHSRVVNYCLSYSCNVISTSPCRNHVSTLTQAQQANFKKIVMSLTCVWCIVYDSINWPSELDL